MKKVFAFALCFPLAACTVGEGQAPSGDDDGTTDPGGTNPGSGSNPGSGTPQMGISGTVATGTWTGATSITGAVTIPTGVTITVAAGSMVTFAASAGITIAGGTLLVMGTSASPVTFAPAVALGHWSGVDIMTAGTLTMTYGTQTGGGIYTDGGTATITDSHLSNANGDYLVMNGGSIDVEYTTIGEETAADSTHCNLHLNSATSIKFTHNNNLNSPYGLMFYGGTGAVFTHNNWISNKATGQIDIEPNPMGTGDFSDSYFSNGQPPGTPGLTYTPLQTARLTDCGPRT